MNTYWDSSALIEAVFDPPLNQRLRREGGFTRPHALAEVFSTLTGNPEARIAADDAALVVQSLCGSLNFVDLTASETSVAMKSARMRGVRGGRIHDFMHAVAAEKCCAEEILTLDKNDFSDLTGLRVEVA